MPAKAGKESAAKTAGKHKQASTAKSTINSKPNTATKAKTVAHVKPPTRARSTRNIKKKYYAAVTSDDEKVDSTDAESDAEVGEDSDAEDMTDTVEPATSMENLRTKPANGAQTMSQFNNRNVDGTFPLFKLPPELREKIFRLHLCPGGPIFPVHIKVIRSFSQHKKRCLLGTHSSRPLKGNTTIAKSGEYAGMKRWSRLVCMNNMTMEEHCYKAPESVLALLETCRDVFTEAVHIFYRFNHFEFVEAYLMHRFLRDCGDRLQYISDIGFRCTDSSLSGPTVALLQELLSLKRITVSIRVKLGPRDDAEGLYSVTSILKKSSSGRQLALLRGIQTLRLRGDDYAWEVRGWRLVDIEHTFGPWLRKQITRPRSEEQCATVERIERIEEETSD